jgi:uncharacterized membrane protein
MSTLLAVLALAAELVACLAVLAFAAVTLGFQGESYRRGLVPLQAALTWLAVLTALAPLLVTVWVAWRRLFSSRPWEDVPLGLGLPVVALLVGAVVALLAFQGGELASSRASEKQRAEERGALRAQVEAGERGKACELVVKDPRCTPADMRRCRELVESLDSPDARWRELEKFLTAGGHFESFNPKELGFTPTWDFNKSLVVVRHEQEWFLRTFYPALLARPETFSTPKGLLRLGTVLRSSSRYEGWTHAAGRVLRAELLPEVTRRLAEAQPRLRGSEELQSAFESATDQLTWLQTPPQDEEPPVPTLAQPAPRESIGLARLESEDGQLHLWLRATPTEGEFGDVYLRFDTHPSFGKDGRAILGHLGGLSPGEVKPVPPLE